MLAAGTYEFEHDMCQNIDGPPSDGRRLYHYESVPMVGSALCIERPVTIEAEVAGSVVIDAKGERRVIYVSSFSGVAKLIGLNIKGGYSTVYTVRH